MNAHAASSALDPGTGDAVRAAEEMQAVYAAVYDEAVAAQATPRRLPAQGWEEGGAEQDGGEFSVHAVAAEIHQGGPRAEPAPPPGDSDHNTDSEMSTFSLSDPEGLVNIPSTSGMSREERYQLRAQREELRGQRQAMRAQQPLAVRSPQPPRRAPSRLRLCRC